MKLKKYHKSGNKLLIVEYGVTVTNHAYFSITGCMGEKRRGKYIDPIYDAEGNKYEFDTGGCIHGEILKVFPDMADIISLHLSDIDGTPMYALENGYYHYRHSDDKVVKNLLRITDSQYSSLVSQLLASEDPKKTFSDFVDSQKPRWKSEADAVIAKYNLHIPELLK